MLRDYLKAEIATREQGSPWWLALKVFLIGGSSRKAVLEYRLASWFSSKGFQRISTLYFHRLESRYALYISKGAEIGAGLKLPHPVGVVIGQGVKIGESCTIFQHVTLGGRNLGDAEDDLYPVIDDNVVVFAGATILGKIRVGSHSVIGANSVVLSDVEEGSVVAGAPARKVGAKK